MTGAGDAHARTIDVLRSLGADIWTDPHYQSFSRARFASGRIAFITQGRVRTNRSDVSQLTRDKDYTVKLLSSLDIPVPRSGLFFRSHLRHTDVQRYQLGEDAAVAFASQLGFPAVAKPNRLQRGDLVSIVHNANECRDHVRAIFHTTRFVQIQEYIKGSVWRATCVGEHIVDVHRIDPLQVLGDGTHSLQDLALTTADKSPDGEERDRLLTNIDLNISLRRRGLTWGYIPPVGKAVRVTEIANLSLWSTATRRTTWPSWLDSIAGILHHQCGLDIFGVDLVTRDSSELTTPYSVLEVNASPALRCYDDRTVDGVAWNDSVEYQALRYLSSR